MGWPLFLARILAGGAVGAGGGAGLVGLANRVGHLPDNRLQRNKYLTNYYNEMMGGDELWDLRENYGHGAYGLPSLATHEAASGHTSDWLVDLLRGGKKDTRPRRASQFMGYVE